METDFFTLENMSKQIQVANQTGAKADATEPRAIAIRSDPQSGRLIMDLNGGLTFMFPSAQLAELHGATAEQLTEAEILPGGEPEARRLRQRRLQREKTERRVAAQGRGR